MRSPKTKQVVFARSTSIMIEDCRVKRPPQALYFPAPSWLLLGPKRLQCEFGDDFGYDSSVRLRRAQQIASDGAFLPKSRSASSKAKAKAAKPAASDPSGEGLTWFRFPKRPPVTKQCCDVGAKPYRP